MDEKDMQIAALKDQVKELELQLIANKPAIVVSPMASFFDPAVVLVIKEFQKKMDSMSEEMRAAADKLRLTTPLSLGEVIVVTGTPLPTTEPSLASHIQEIMRLVDDESFLPAYNRAGRRKGQKSAKKHPFWAKNPVKKSKRRG